jgi:enterochelin esterase family protein
MSRIIFACLILAAGAFAQPSPAVVNPERTVTFTFRAPEAKKVAVNADFPGGFANLDLQRNADGEWTVTTPHLPRGSYYFRFVVDGVPVLLSAPAAYIASTPTMELVHVRGDEALPYEITDPRMPRGALTTETFYSEFLGRSVRYTVYAPPGYSSSQKLYPVVYLLHGNRGVDPSIEDGKQRFPGNALMWTDVGFADRIADRLIFDRAIREVILVSVDAQGPRAQPPVTPEAELATLITFENYLVDEVVPRVEGQYRIEKGQPYRSLAGFSRGALLSFHVGMRRPDLFSALGVFSAGAPIPFPDSYPAVRDSVNLNSQVRIFVAEGREDTIAPFAAVESLHKALDQLGIRHTYHATDGEHSLQNWRLYLAEFLRTLG